MLPGERAGPRDRLFYAFNLKDRVRNGHLSRRGDAVPDPSTFSVNRRGRFRDSDMPRSVFENVARRCRPLRPG